jgi:hypothetical protein
MRADVNYLAKAYEGRKDMLYFIFGKSEEPGKPGAPPKGAKLARLTARAFDTLFGRSKKQ